jgi:hypothetical protein
MAQSDYKDWHNFYLILKKKAMLKEEKEQLPDNNEKLPYAFSDEVTKRRIKSHISDINDIITENDIKNVKVPGNEKTQQVPAEKKEKKTRKSKKPVIDEVPGNPVTPWDILDEQGS